MPANTREVIAREVEEHIMDHLLGVFRGSQIARTNAAINFGQTLGLGRGRILRDGGQDIFHLIITVHVGKKLFNLGITTNTKGAQ